MRALQESPQLFLLPSGWSLLEHAFVVVVILHSGGNLTGLVTTKEEEWCVDENNWRKPGPVLGGFIQVLRCVPLNQGSYYPAHACACHLAVYYS